MRLTSLLAVLSGVALAGPDSSNGWGYDLDSLRRDLVDWKAHPDVRIDSIGASVQGRPLWMVTITDRTDSVASAPGRTGPKRRVVVHARTHPWEVQSQHVANGMIRALLEPSEQAAILRRDFLFHIVPQYNPDGIVLGSQRFNANGVDLEGNWTASVMEPEAAALKRLFVSFMEGTIPVEVALNLHSDQFNCTRFFFFHLPGGTSERYALQEQAFIADVQSHFRGGIEDWNFVASWANAPVLRYPEGFWWSGWREQVLALTYEDANCPDAGGFDSTGRALVLGTAEHLGKRALSSRRDTPMPMPLHLGSDGVHLQVPDGSRWELRDVTGRRIGSGDVIRPVLPWALLPGHASAILLVRTPGGVVHRILLPRR